MAEDIWQHFQSFSETEEVVVWTVCSLKGCYSAGQSMEIVQYTVFCHTFQFCPVKLHMVIFTQICDHTLTLLPH